MNLLGIRAPVWIVAGFLLAGTLVLRLLADAPESPVVRASDATMPASAISAAPPEESGEVPRAARESAPLEEEARADERVGAQVGSDDERAASPVARDFEEAGIPSQAATDSGIARPDARLAVLEEEAARASLRRGLAAPERSDFRAENARSAEAERRFLSDELLIDHLVAESYRTTGFAYEADAAGESRAEAQALIRGLGAAERRALLEESLADPGDHPAPSFGEPRQRVDQIP